MSDLCMYEFEDIIWDDLCQRDDHIVPCPHSLLCQSGKKSHCEITDIPPSTEERSSAEYVDGGSKGQFSSLSKWNNNKMLERDSRSHAPSGAFSSSSDERASSLVSEKTTSSCHVFKSSKADSDGNEFSVGDSITNNKITGYNNNSSTDPLGDITHADSNLNFFENSEVKDSSDFLYSSWLEIENFEDVDRMFRSCDSTFGLGASKEDESGWFLSSDSIGGTSEIMNSDFKFSCPESNSGENLSMSHESLKNHSSNDDDMMSAPVTLRDCPWISDKPDSYVSLVNGPAISNGDEGFVPEAQINEHQKLVKLQNNSHKAFSLMRKQQQPDVLGPDSSNYLQNHLFYGHPDSSPLSGLTSVCPTSSAIKTETNELSTSTKDSSHASNLLASTDGSDDCPPPVTATRIGNREQSYDRHGSRSPVESDIKPGNIMVQATSNNRSPVEKEAHYGDESENHCDAEEFRFIPAELGSSNIQQSSRSGVDDISLEAASFRQLQLVMEQLDLRTKICIRDSLYRLARSAEQRHNNHANLNSSCGDGRDASGALITEGEKNFLDIETDTNPIDRSVAHLLFHRPSELSPVSVHDSLSFKSPITVQGCVTSKPSMKNTIDSEEMRSDTKVSDQ